MEGGGPEVKLFGKEVESVDKLGLETVARV
jgi:hypothetical protein